MDKSKKIKIIIIIALFSFSGVYLFFTTIGPNFFSNKTTSRVVTPKSVNNNLSNSVNTLQKEKEEKLKEILPSSNSVNPFLPISYLNSFSFIEKTSLSIVSPPEDAIKISDLYFVGTFFDQDTKTLRIIINNGIKNIYISKGDMINEIYGKLKLMKVYTNFLLFMDKDGKKYYIQK